MNFQTQPSGAFYTDKAEDIRHVCFSIFLKKGYVVCGDFDGTEDPEYARFYHWALLLALTKFSLKQ